MDSKYGFVTYGLMDSEYGFIIYGLMDLLHLTRAGSFILPLEYLQ